VKVLHVIDSLGVGGGAEHSLAAMLPLLRDRGIDSSIATIRPRGFGLEVSLAEAGFDIEVLEPANWPGRIRALRSKIRRERPDVVHASLFNSCMIARLAAIGTGVPQVNSLVLTAYDPSRTEGIGAAPWKLRVVRTVDGLSARHLVDHVHAVTGAVRTEAIDVLGVDPARISVIPRGRSAELLGERSDERRRSTRRSLGLSDDTTVVLNVGRQDHQKAQAGLIRAFALLHARRPDSVLLIAGREGDATAEVDAALAEVDLGEAIHMLGHRDDVADLYCAADLFVFPSLYEGMAGSILEAMALSTPVVGSDAVAITEVLDDGRFGPIARRGDDLGLADAMDGLLADPDRMAELSQLGRAEFVDRYEINAVADAMAEMYRSVVAAGRGRR
jgi:glycosyltransferase involved in cell wall biosynthesis